MWHPREIIVNMSEVGQQSPLVNLMILAKMITLKLYQNVRDEIETKKKKKLGQLKYH